MQEKELINKMTVVFDNVASLGEDLKTLKEEAKAKCFDAGILATVAKAISDGKSGKLRGKYESTLDLLDKLDD